MRRLIVAAINVYQAHWSPDHSPRRRLYPAGYCRYYPSCSEYGKQAFQRHGFWKATQLTIARLIRCHPWSAGGVDPVPHV